MVVSGEINLVIIREESGGQRVFLIENREEGFDVIMSGDRYDGISDRVTGFIEGLDFGRVSFSVREFETWAFGENFQIKKEVLKAPVGDNPNLDTFCITSTRSLDEIY